MFLGVLIPLLFLLLSVAAYDCQKVEPLVIEIKNGTADPKNGIAFNRGVVIQFNPSKQPVSLRASFIWNNTRIRNDVDCKNGNSAEVSACLGASGTTFVFNTGDFNQLLKKDWQKRTLTTDYPPVDAQLVTGWAAASLDDGPNLELPLEVWSDTKMTLDSANKSLISLASKSSFVWNLLQESLAPSNFTGYDHGSRSSSRSINGEVVIGGLNHARVAGNFVNYTIAQYSMPSLSSCSLVVKVNSFVINNIRGSFNVLEPGKPELACIDPLQNSFYLPSRLFQRWSNFTERPEPQKRPDYQSYPKGSKDMLGSLDIALEGGYSVRIPQFELVSDERGPNLKENGQYDTVDNSTLIHAGVSSGESDYGEDFGILLGGIFLSSTYLFVDWDNGKFGLAPSTRVEPNYVPRIQKVCSNDTSIPPPPRTSTKPESSANSNSSDRIALGLGLGISLPSCILAALSVYLFLRYHPGYIPRVLSWHHNGKEDERHGSVAHVLPPLRDMHEHIDLKAVLLTRSREGSTVPASPGPGVAQ